MNIYFVFEGKTEPIVYKNWLKFLVPNLIEVEAYDSVKENNYFYESDMGVPSCYRVAANAVQEINEHNYYDFLVLCIDADRSLVEEKKQEANNQITEELKYLKYKSLPKNCKLEIIVQKVCIETWFLGNNNFFVPRPEHNSLLKEYIKYYNVSVEDPEDLAADFEQNEDNSNEIFGYKTKALFHEGYLREIFKERNLAMPKINLSYRKSSPREVQEKFFLNAIIKRINTDSGHLRSFQSFIQFCSYISDSI
jgi:hypothetical protein